MLVKKPGVPVFAEGGQPAPKKAENSGAQNSTGPSSVLISLQQLETIALSSVRLAAMGPRLARVAGKMEKQADEQARLAAEIACGTNQLTKNLNDLVTRLQDASVNVHSVIGEIARIAEQTRLLSINASIEASRAGEQGRAFNVVAREVQQLADQTHQSTRVIEERVEAIQGSVRELSASVTDKKGDGIASDKRTIVTVQTMNAEVQAMADAADGQRGEARSLHELGEQASQLTQELLLAVGGFRLEVHRVAAAQIRGFLSTVAKKFALRRGLEEELLSWLHDHPGFELLYVTDTGGRQTVANVGWKSDRTVLEADGYNRDWRDRSWYRNAMRDPETVAVSDIYRSAATSDFCFTVSAVIHSPDGKPLGVLGADVNFQRLLTGNVKR